jgi:hypothetical protein
LKLKEGRILASIKKEKDDDIKVSHEGARVWM